MAQQDIPLTDDTQTPNTASDFAETIVLDGTTYVLTFRWLDRGVRNLGLPGAWFMGVYDATGATNLLGETKLVADFTLYLYRARNAIVATTEPPAGFLIPEDTSGAGLDPGFGDLGGRTKLRYYTKDDIVAVVTG